MTVDLSKVHIILSELWSKSLDILHVFRYCVSLIGGDTRERLYAGAAPAVLPGAGVCGRAKRDRGAPPGSAGADGSAEPGKAAEAGRPGHRTAGRDFPGGLHRRVPAGPGDRRRAGTLLLRRRGRGAGAAPDGARSAMKLASLYQRKGAEEREVNGHE